MEKVSSASREEVAVFELCEERVQPDSTRRKAAETRIHEHARKNDLAKGTLCIRNHSMDFTLGNGLADTQAAGDEAWQVIQRDHIWSVTESFIGPGMSLQEHAITAAG